MTSRVLLFTGKGGVGKTTMAAATAARVAANGQKTLVLSTDPAHSLADALGAPVASEPSEVASGLFVSHVDTQGRLDEVWGELQGYLVSALGASGLDSVRAEELTVLPGAEELLALLEVREQAVSGRWDAVIVDCAPTGETLRLLTLPEVLDWYLRRALPAEAKVVRALRPLLGSATGLPAPKAEVWQAAERLQEQLLQVQQVLRSDQTSVRLVLTPEAVVVAESRRSLTQLALYGYRVDGVIANKVFEAGDDPWRARWAASQARVLGEVRDSFEPLPVMVANYLEAEPVGAESLERIGAFLYGRTDPLAGDGGHEFMSVSRDGSDYLLALALPLIDKETLELSRIGEEFVVNVAGRRRVFVLPSVLRWCDVVGASVEGNHLLIRFQPGPRSAPTPKAHP